MEALANLAQVQSFTALAVGIMIGLAALGADPAAGECPDAVGGPRQQDTQRRVVGVRRVPGLGYADLEDDAQDFHPEGRTVGDGWLGPGGWHAPDCRVRPAADPRWLSWSHRLAPLLVESTPPC